MKLSPLAVLAALCAALGLALASLWVTPTGQLRDAVHWRAPAALEADYSAVGPALAHVGEPDAQRHTMLLDRPLFSRTRRPPEPVAAAPADAWPDRLGQARLRAIVEGPQAGGSIIVEIDGKSHRIQKQSLFEGWTLASINTQARTATMTRRGQKRVLTLQRGQLSAGPSPARASLRPPLTRSSPSASVSRTGPRPSGIAGPAPQATQAPGAADAPPEAPGFVGTQR